MRNGLLFSILLVFACHNIAQAQYPPYRQPYPAARQIVPVSYSQWGRPYPPPVANVAAGAHSPGMMHDYPERPAVLLGGALQANGAIPLPSMRGKLIPVTPDAKPIPAPEIHFRQIAAPGPVPSTRQPNVQPASLTHNHGISGHLPAPYQALPSSVPGLGENVIIEDDSHCPADCESCDEPPMPMVIAEQPIGHYQPRTWHGMHMPKRSPRGYKLYGSVEYLYWFTPTQSAPALLANSATNSTLIGGGDLNFDDGQRHGGRTTLGVWLNKAQTLGLEGSYLFFWEGGASQTISSDAVPSLVRPFIDANTGTPSGVIIANPGISTGRSTVDTFSRLWGVEANLRKELCRGCWGNLDLLAGFRHLHLDEHLEINDFSQVGTAPVILSDASVFTNDYFGTQNVFYGGQLGLQGDLQYGRAYLNLWGKIALGNNRQMVRVNGSTTIFNAPPPIGDVSTPGGVLAQPTNIGIFTRDQFTVIPTAGIKVGMRLNDYLRIGGGYSVLYINNVVRPGDQIDPVVNPLQIPQLFSGPVSGPLRPAFLFQDSDYWAHALNVELEFRF